MGAGNPATFRPAQIRHGSITATEKNEPRHLNIFTTSTDPNLRKFLLTAAPVKIKLWVLRFNDVAVLTGDPIDFTTNGQIIESGILGKFGFSQSTIAAELTPEVFFQNGEVPRLYFSRRCNHVLYGPGCGLDRDHPAFTFATTIAALDPVQREILVTGQKADVGGDYFSAGHISVPILGLHFTVGWSAHDAANTKLKLTTWHPELVLGQSVVVLAGCRHTVADCRRFGNVANFGGFPHVPNRNPTVNSIAT